MIVSWQPGMSLEQLERMAIEAAFRFHRGNKTATAQSLKIAIRTLDNKLAQYASEEEKANAASKQREHENRNWLDRQRNGRVASRGTSGENQSGIGQTPNGQRSSGQSSGGIGGETERSPGGTPESHGADDKSHLESSAAITEKSAMPLPKREEIQGVSPRQTTPNRNGGRR